MKRVFSLINIAVLLLHLFVLSIKADSSRVIWVGDSRFVGMKQSVQTSESDLFIAEGGMGYVWFVNSAIPQVNQTIQKGDKIVIGMGANGFGADQYVKTVNALVQNEWKECDVYFMSVNPFVDDKVTANGMVGTDADVQAFNKAVRSGIDKNVKYIDTYSQIKDGIESKTQDGVHYTVECYQEIYDLVCKSLNGQTLAEKNDFSKHALCNNTNTPKMVPGGTFIYFRQWGNQPWSNKYFGSGYTYGSGSCGMTSLAMILATFTNDPSLNPEALHLMMKKHGVDPGQTLAMTTYTEGARYVVQDLGIEMDIHPINYSEAAIKEVIDAGGYVHIVGVNPAGTFTYDGTSDSPYSGQGHYGVVVSYDERGFYIADPSRPAMTTINTVAGEFNETKGTRETPLSVNGVLAGMTGAMAYIPKK